MCFFKVRKRIAFGMNSYNNVQYFLQCLFYYIVLRCNCAADPPNTKEAIAWLYKASAAGQVQAQCQLALCWHQGRVLNQNVQEVV